MMDGMTIPPAPRDEAAELREQNRLLLVQMNEMRGTLRSIANSDDVLPEGVTYRQRCSVWRGWAKASLVRAEGG
jgi:hypothetical protein